MINTLTVLKHPLIRCLSLVILLTYTTEITPLTFAVIDPDLWWHLRDGDWIVANHAVPYQGVFSQYVSLPWLAYSWGSEIILSRFYHWFGLMGFVVLRVAIEAAITGILFLILWRRLGHFWGAWGLTAAGIWAIHHCLLLQPMLFSILMFTIEIGLLWEARRTKNPRPLFLLPLMFLVWANLHIQFIYGLFVLMLLTGIGVLRSILPKTFMSRLEPEQDLPVQTLLIVCGFSLLATLIGPYSWRLYGVILSYAQSSYPYHVIVELKALSFREPGHYLLVLLLAGAFFALGWRRSRDPFQLALLVICTVVGFRMTRDSWFACIPALVMIADRKQVTTRQNLASPIRVVAMAGATVMATVVVFFLMTWDSKINNRSLAQVVGEAFPAQACDYVRARSLSGPIYNDMTWGGFIIWSLPEYPVAVDNRTDLYGDAIMERNYRTQNGASGWKSNPDLNAANLILLNSESGLAMLLYHDTQFRVVYYDSMAVVFTRNKTNPSTGAEATHP